MLWHCSDWEGWDIHLVKLAACGSGGCDSPPSVGMSAEFNAVVHECLSKAPDSVVVVFDEYGFNRSCTLIARYGVTRSRVGQK